MVFMPVIVLETNGAVTEIDLPRNSRFRKQFQCPVDCCLSGRPVSTPDQIVKFLGTHVTFIFPENVQYQFSLGGQPEALSLKKFSEYVPDGFHLKRPFTDLNVKHFETWY